MNIASISFATLALCASQSTQAVGLISLVDVGGGLQSLNSFDSATPGASNLTPITGLGVGESLLGIDFRPATGQLFGLGSGNRLYTVNTVTGAASVVGSGFSSVTLTASAYGFDFNPVIDRIRIVGTDNSNTVGNPDTGGDTVVTAVFYPTGDPNVGADPNLVHHAYTNSVNPAPGSTALFALDSILDILVTQANSAGTLGTVGSLGVDFDELGGFDIDGNTGIAYAALRVGGASNLYTIDLGTGAASLVGGLTGTVSGFAVVPEPSSALLLGLGALGLLRRKRSN